MRSHGISGIFFGNDIRRSSSTRRARQAVAVATLAILSVGCAVGSRVSLPPLPVVALFDLLAALLPAGSTGGSYGPTALSTNFTTTGTGTVSACQFVSMAGTTQGSNVVPLGLTITVGTPPGGAPNTGCVISGVIDPTVNPGTYTFTVRAADSSSPPQSDTQTYTIIVSSLQIALTLVPAPPGTTVTGQAIGVSWTFTINPPGGPNPSQQALVELLGPTMLVEDSCVANLTALTCGALNSTTAGAHTIRLTYPNPPGMDANYPGTTTVSVAHTVNPAATTTTVTTAPDPSVTGQMYAANVVVATNAPGAGAPTGTVAVSDGLGNSCNAMLTPGANQSTGTCNLNAPTAGPRTVTASYPGDANYAASMGSDPHTVNPAATTTMITSDAPDPSVTGESYIVNWTVTVNAPGAGTPTGTVTVDDGTGAMCSAAVAAGTCTITSVTAGNKTLTANYSGDANFNASADTEAHVVNQASTTTTITSDLPDPSVTGEAYTINVTVDTVAPGAGQPTGTVTINDGQGQSCMAVLAPGPGANQSSGTCMNTSITTAVTTLTANYPGDANFAGSMDTEGHTVTLALTTTTINTIVPSPSAVGQATTVSVTVAPNPPGTGAPTGSVMINDGFGGTCNIAALTPGVNQSTGSCMLTSTTTSVAVLTANYSGDANFNGSVGLLGHTVTAAATTTALVSNINPSTFGQLVTFTATVTVNPPGMGTPTGTVDFVDNTTATALCTNVPLAGNSAQCLNAALGAGMHDVQATYSGDGNFGLSMGNVTQTVNQSATTTALMSSVNPSVFTQAVTFTATIAPVAPGAGTPTGTVNFVDNTLAVSLTGCAAVPVMGGVATCVVTDLQAGNHNVQATYNGDANFQLSLSNVVAQVVNPNTTTVLMSSSNPSVFQQLISFTATVTDLPGGNPVLLGDVTFVDTSTAAILCANVPLVLGQAVCSTSTLSVATHNVQATYNGVAGTFSVSLSNVVAQVVNQAATTSLLSLVAGTNPSTVGDSLTFNALVFVTAPGSGAPTAPTGTVTFTNTTTAAVLCLNVPLNVLTQDANCTTMALPAGMNDIQATFTGDANFTGNMSNLLNQTVNQAASTTTLLSSANPSVSGQTVTFTATVNGLGPVPTGTIQFRINTVNVGAPVALVGGMASLMQAFTVAVSTEDVDAVYSGDANYAASNSNTVTQVINQAASTTNVMSSANPSVSGETVTFTATVAAAAPGAGTPTGTVDFRVNTVVVAAGVPLVGGVATFMQAFTVAVSTEDVDAVYSGDTEFTGNTSNTVVQVINQATVTVAVMPPGAPTVTGETYQVDVTVTANAPGAGTPTGSITISDGLDTCNIAALVAGAGNCMITSTTAGAKTLTATYSGDTEFTGNNGTAMHTVNAAATLTTVNDKQVGAVSQNTTLTGEDYEVLVTVVTQAPGTGEPTGMVMIQDDDANPTDSCMATLVPGAPGSNTSTGVCTILNSRSQNNATDNIEATYQGDGNFAVNTGVVFPHVVNKGGTGLNGGANIVKSVDPTVVGETYTVTVSVNASIGEGNPTGTVDVDDGQGAMCTTGALVPGPGLNQSTASCMLTSTTVASNQLNASYAGDADFNGVSASNVHTVNQAATTTMILTHTPDPSLINTAVTVSWSVTVNAPGSGTPTGTVTVIDQAFPADTCSAAVAAGSCMITLTNTGARLLQATYSGDTDFLGSNQMNVAHSVVIMAIATTPAAPGGIMGDGVNGRAIGGGTAGASGVSFAITGGTAPYTCTLNAGAPTGVMVTAVASNCVLSGAPTGTGTFMFTITADDNGAVNTATTATITWTVNAALAFTSTGMPGAAVDQRNYLFMMTSSGGTGVKTFDNNGTALATQDVDCTSFAIAANGDLTATPAALQAGNNVCDFTARVQDMASTSTAAGSATQAHSIPLNAALTVTPATIPNGKRQATYNPTGPGFTVTAMGGTGVSLTWTALSNFTLTAGNWVGNVATPCEGLQFPQAPGGNTTTITGTPVNAGTLPGAFSATCSFTMQADDASNGPTAGGNGMTAYSSIIFNTVAYVANTGATSLTAINTDTNAVINSVTLSGSPRRVAVTQDGRYTIATVGNTINVLDNSTNTLLGNSPFDTSAECDTPRGIAPVKLASGVNRIFLACDDTDANDGERIAAFDLNPTGGAGGNGAIAFVASADVDQGNVGGSNEDRPLELAVTRDNTTVYAVITRGAGFNGRWARVNVATAGLIDATSFSVVGADCGDPVSIAIRPGVAAEEAYVTCDDEEEIAIIDVATNTQVDLGATNIATGIAGVNSIAFTPDGSRAYVTQDNDDMISVIDTAARTLTNHNMPAPPAATQNVNSFGITIPVPPNNAPTVEIFITLTGTVATFAPGVAILNDGTPPTSGTNNTLNPASTPAYPAATAPQSIAAIPRPRQ